MSFTEAHKQWLDGTPYPHTDADPKDCPGCKATTERAYAESAALLDGHRQSAEAPGIVETLEVLAEHLRELTALQRRILEALGSSSDSRSSVELKVSSARSAPDPTVKVYAGSSVEGLVDTALDEFGRLKREADARAMAGWAATLSGYRCGKIGWAAGAPDAVCELPSAHDGRHGFNT